MIKEYRKKRNLTQEELSEMVNLSTRQLQRIEVDEDRTKIETMRKIIRILQIPDVEILKYIKKDIINS